MRKLVAFIFCIIQFQNLFSQEYIPENFLIDKIESLIEHEECTINYDEIIENLAYLRKNPINLNNTSKTELEQLIFLTDNDIENILFYIYQHKPLLTLYELQAVEGLKIQTIKLLLPFVSIQESSLPLKKTFKGNILTRLGSTLETPEGYLETDSTTSAYLGSKEKLLIKGNMEINQKILSGFTLEKDPGESYYYNSNLTDFQSAFLEWKNPTKYIDNIIIGDFKVAFGQGLGMWTDLAFSKTNQTAQIRRRAKGIQKYSSSNECNYLRGIALNSKYDKFTLSPFFSTKYIDATSNSDSLSISSLTTSGYHRTYNELNKKHNTREVTIGNNLSYKHHLFHLDLGYANWKIDKPLQPESHMKNIYKFSGKEINKVWLAHSVFFSKIRLYGEITSQNNYEISVYEGITFSPTPDIILSASYRNYNKKYNSQFANPFANSSNPSAEEGYFTSFYLRPQYKLEFTGYFDLFNYSWLKHSSYAPSNGSDYLLQLNYQINDYSSTYFRIKTKKDFTNNAENSKQYTLISSEKTQYRINYKFKINKNWSSETQLNYNFYKNSTSYKAQGYLIYQDFKCDFNSKATVAFRYAMFNTDDFNSRIYSYDPDVLYAFSIPSYSDKGYRLTFNLKYSVNNHFIIWMKIGHTNYANKNIISSGNQQINSNCLNEGKIQINYSF